METIYIGDKVIIDSNYGVVIVADTMDDGSQWLKIEIEGCVIPVILSNECQIPKDWTDICESYADAGSIDWINVEFEKIKTHGGKRVGAGNKPKENPLPVKSIRCTNEEMVLVKEFLKRIRSNG